MTLDEIWFQILINAKQPQGQQQEERREEKQTERRAPNRPIPRNNQRPIAGGVVNGKLSLKAVDPSNSFHDIGQQLLRDIRKAESRE